MVRYNGMMQRDKIPKDTDMFAYVSSGLLIGFLFGIAVGMVTTIWTIAYAENNSKLQIVKPQGHWIQCKANEIQRTLPKMSCTIGQDLR